MQVICAKCNKVTKNPAGSLKHPYCKPCFNQAWKNHEEYYAFISKTH